MEDRCNRIDVREERIKERKRKIDNSKHNKIEARDERIEKIKGKVRRTQNGHRGHRVGQTIKNRLENKG